MCPSEGPGFLPDELGFGKSGVNGWDRKPALRCFYIYIISIRTHHPGFCCGIQAKQGCKSLLGMGLFIPQGLLNSISLKGYRLLDLVTQR
jgi:hypothetical protein